MHGVRGVALLLPLRGRAACTPAREHEQECQALAGPPARGARVLLAFRGCGAMSARRLPHGLRGSLLGAAARLPYCALGPSPWRWAYGESPARGAADSTTSPGRGASLPLRRPGPVPIAPLPGRPPQGAPREGFPALTGGSYLASAPIPGCHGATARACPSHGAIAGIGAPAWHPRRLSTGAGGRTRAVGFEISQEEAMGAFRRDIAGHLAGPIGAMAGSAQVTDVRAVFLPFWAFSASVDVLYQGQVGANQEATVWNPISRRWERVVHTQWSSTPLHQMRAECPSSDPDMHFYASTEHPRSLVEPLVGQRLVSPPPGPLSEDMLSGNRELELFQIRREMAWSAVKRRVLRAKRQQAYDQLRKDYGTSVAHSVEVDLRVLKVTAEPIFFPCYIIKYQQMGQQLAAAVSGVDGTVLGQRIFSPLKVGAAVAGTLWALGFLAATHSSVWLFSAGLLGLAAGYAARYVPLIGAALQQVGHVRDVAQLQMTDSSAAAEELRRAEAPHSRERRDRGRGAEQDGWGQHSRGREEGSAWGAGAGPFVFWRTRQSGGLGGGLDEMLREMERMMREAAAREHASRYGWQQASQQEQWQRQAGTGQSRQRERAHSQGTTWGERTQGSPGDPKGYYKALGLEGKGQQASEQEIKSAFRKMAMKTHPDKELDETRRKHTEQAFKRIAEAYEVLRDPQKRAAYDSGFA